MPAAYPLNLRTIIRASKSRQQPAAFSMSEPRRGKGYVNATGTDTPVFWDVMFRFTSCEATLFQLWFTQTIARGVDEFEMPIRTEFGLLTHTCRFMPDGLLQTREDGEVWEYTAQIMARAQLIPADALTAYAASFSGPIPNQNVYNGEDYTLALAGYWTAGVGPYTYSVARGTLPPGLTLDPNTGVISGVYVGLVDAVEFPGLVFRREDVFCVSIDSNAVLFTALDSPPAPVVASQSAANMAFGTSWSPTLPSGIQSGDLLLSIIFTGASFTDPAVTSGWTILDTELGVSGPNVVIAAKMATGSDSLTLSTNVLTSNWASHVSFRITGASAITDVEYAYSAAGTSATTVSFSALTPSGGLAERLWLAVYGWLGDGTADVSAAPSGYSNAQDTAPVAATNKPAAASARKTALSSSETPGNATLSANRTSYRSITIAVNA